MLGVVVVALQALQAGGAGGQHLDLAAMAARRASRSAPLRTSCSLRKRTCVEMSGRVTASVPDSPQQRSFFSIAAVLRARSSAC